MSLYELKPFYYKHRSQKVFDRTYSCLDNNNNTIFIVMINTLHSLVSEVYFNILKGLLIFI